MEETWKFTFSLTYHPQMDDQIEAVNMKLGNLLRCLTKQVGAAWDLVLGQVEYAYNDSINRFTGKTPFEVVYGFHPRGTMVLRDIHKMQGRSAMGENFVEAIKSAHEEVKAQLEKSMAKYKEREDQTRKEKHFKVGDLELTFLRKERLTKVQFTKLVMKKICPFKILHKYGENAYENELPPDIGILPIFNIEDLTLYKGDIVISDKNKV